MSMTSSNDVQIGKGLLTPSLVFIFSIFYADDPTPFSFNPISGFSRFSPFSSYRNSRRYTSVPFLGSGLQGSWSLRLSAEHQGGTLRSQETKWVMSFQRSWFFLLKWINWLKWLAIFLVSLTVLLIELWK